VTDDKLCSEIIWQTVQDFQLLASHVKLKKENSKDLTNTNMATDSPTGCSSNLIPYLCKPNNLEELFPIEKYSKYTGAVTKWYVNPNSPEHFSLNSGQECEFEFHNPTSEEAIMNNTSSSEILTNLKHSQKQNMSNDCSITNGKQGIECGSNLGSDRHHSSRKLYLRKLRQRNTPTTTSEEEGTSGSIWKMDSDVPNVSKPLMKNTIRYEDHVASYGRKVEHCMTEKEGKNEKQNRGNDTSNNGHKTCILKTEMVMELASLNESSKNKKYVKKCNDKKSGTLKSKSSKLGSKRSCESNMKPMHYFQMRNTKRISLFSSSEQGVKTQEELYTNVSSSDDCVPGTPVHATQFGVQYTNKTENSPVKNPTSLVPQLNSKSVDYNTDKSSSKNVPESTIKTEITLGHYSKHLKKEKCSKLSTRRRRHKSTAEVSESGSPVQLVKCSVARKTEIINDALSGTANENTSQLKHQSSINLSTRKGLGESGRGSSLQGVFLQQLKPTVRHTKKGDSHNEYSCNSSREESRKITRLPKDSSLYGVGQQELKIVPDVSLKTSDNSETSHRQEVAQSSDIFKTNHEQVVTGSDSEGQDFKVSHLTLEQLDQRFNRNVKYLRDILNGKKYCWRHEQFKKGGTNSYNLHYAIATFPYTDSQLDHLLLLLRNTFCRKHSFVTFYDYIVKVLLPEAATKIFMDEFSLSHHEALHKLHKIHIISDTSGDMTLPWLPSDS
jgi:hypothetical protein